MDEAERKKIQQIHELLKELLNEPEAFDETKLKWIKTEGEKGTYEKCSEPLNQEYNRAVSMLEYGGGSFSHHGYYYWLFNDKSTIGRKPTASVQHPSKTPATEVKAIDKMRTIFPDELYSILTFTEEEGFIKAKPTKFLGSDDFGRIASVVRANGGEYVSAGKESHFRFSKTKA